MCFEWFYSIFMSSTYPNITLAQDFIASFWNTILWFVEKGIDSNYYISGSPYYSRGWFSWLDKVLTIL